MFALNVQKRFSKMYGNKNILFRREHNFEIPISSWVHQNNQWKYVWYITDNFHLSICLIFINAYVMLASIIGIFVYIQLSYLWSEQRSVREDYVAIIMDHVLDAFGNILLLHSYSCCVWLMKMRLAKTTKHLSRISFSYTLCIYASWKFSSVPLYEV